MRCVAAWRPVRERRSSSFASCASAACSSARAVQSNATETRRARCVIGAGTYGAGGTAPPGGGGAAPVHAWLFIFPSSRPSGARDFAFTPDGRILAAGSVPLAQSNYAVVEARRQLKRLGGHGNQG